MKRQDRPPGNRDHLTLVQALHRSVPVPVPRPPTPLLQHRPSRLSADRPLEALFERCLTQHRRVLADIEPLRPAICDAAMLMADTLRCGGRLLFFGDACSAADSLHLAAEFNSRLRRGRLQLAAVALGAPTLAAIANNYGFDQVFEREIQVHCRPGDCAVALSATGSALSVQRGLAAALAQNMASVGLLGGDGGAARKLVDMAVVVPEQDSTRVQEAHLFIGHTWCRQIESALGIVP